MTNEQMDPCRDDGLCSSCADAPRCAACGEYLPEHEDDCDREFVSAAEVAATWRCQACGGVHLAPLPLGPHMGICPNVLAAVRP